ncbi:hypothetical protein, partial [Burkholderia cenocepacia]|uniref:hypothetical protein n=1 Tax=Burkholderia cenocepacia TaxID=95486 RepID=UPI001E520844
RAGRRLRNGAGDAPRGDCAKKSAGRALARWLGRVDGRDGGGRRATSYAMRALRLGGWSAPGGGCGMARAPPGAATA